MVRTPKAPDTTKPAAEAAKPAASPPVTFDLNDPTLQAMLAQAVAVALAAQKAELVQAMPAAKPATNGGKSDRSLKNEIAVVKAFKKAGYGVVVPHVDVMTFNRWMARGKRPMEGSKSLSIKNLRLFHKSQVRDINLEEKAELQAQRDAAVARHQAAANANVLPMVTA
jgi:hypothetical protein